MIRYLKNTYVLIGGIGIIFYLWKRKQILKNLPKYKKGELALGRDKPDENSDLPLDFVNDVKNMSKDEILRSIEHNKKMMKRAKLNATKKAGMERMLNFLSEEYDSRII